MKAPTIRTRMLLAALLPVFLISVLLAVFFLKARLDDVDQGFQQRSRAVARQLALASEYGLFSANQSQLQLLVSAGLQEPDVLWVRILDAQGQALASSGVQKMQIPVNLLSGEANYFDQSTHSEWLIQPVLASRIKLDDVYEDQPLASDKTPVLLGQIQIGFSHQRLEERKRNMLLLGGLISSLGLFFGLTLALYLSRGVIRPIARISNLIERIGNSDFAGIQPVQAHELLDDPLRDLQLSLQHTAQRLMHARDDLEQQVATATQALRVKKEEAEQATQAKSRFLAAASHDLRQPMHALGMFVARLAQLQHDPSTQKLIDNLELSVRAMQGLLDGLLDISRLDAGVVKVDVQALALGSLLQRLQHDLQPSAHEKGLRLRVRPSTLWVTSDATLLYRILLNLAGNALRYTQQGGVLLACRQAGAGKSVCIEVWDTGIGIAPEHQSSVFNEFFQVANVQRDRSKGLGLGLNIVQRSCFLLGHDVQLRSRLGVGTRFRITLPRAAAASDSQSFMTTHTEKADDLLGVTVLVVEDDALACAALEGLLQAWGMRVQTAGGMQAALKLLRAGFLPALLISDYRLGEGINGIDLIALLQSKLPAAVPACLISGDTDPAVIQAAQAAELPLLSKPVRPAKLRNLLRRMLQGQRDARAERS